MQRASTIFTTLLVLALFGALLTAQQPASAATTELFFSEYVEGSSYNKALEIYNGTGAPVDLAAGLYSIKMFFNGSTTAGLTIPLTGVVEAGDVYVVTNLSAAQALKDAADLITTTTGWFNGDDAVVLYKGDAPIDVIGQVGFDPGSYWGSGAITTVDHTLRRLPTVCAGDPIGSDAFDPTLEWKGFAIDTFDGLGAHTATCDVQLDYTPIYDLQYTTDPSGASPFKDQVGVTTEGIVTAVFYRSYFIEDPAGGPWNGLFVYDTVNIPALGDRLRLTGTLVEYYNLTELKTLTSYEVLSSGNPLPAPATLPTGQVSQEQWESVLVKVENATVSNADLGNGEWAVDDGSGGEVRLDDKGSYTYVPAIGDLLVSITGPLDYTYEAFKIQPRDDKDIELPAPPVTMVINEILADPAADLTGDANGDGIAHYGNDEFVEIVNASDTDADLSGWTLADGYTVRHTFPAGTVVPANCSIVVFGGGAPSGDFGGAVVQTASSTTLGLNNTGDTVTLSDGNSIQAQVAYGAEGGYDQSLTRDPDISGAFVQHTLAAGADGARFSPGTMVAGTRFAGCAQPDPFGACGEPATFIHAVQGSGPASPLAGATNVVIEGVVVGDFQDTATQLKGFFLQEEDSQVDADRATSEGIFVYDYGFMDVNVGDVVRVLGNVTEYYQLTELNGVSQMALCGTGTASPAIVELPVASLDVWEQHEGMLIHLPQTLFVTDNYTTGRYGEVELSVNARLDQPTNVVWPGAEALALQELNNRSRIQLEDGSTLQNPIPAPYMGLDNTLRSGDTLAGLTGVLNFAFGYYEVHPVQAVEFTRANPRQLTPADVGGKIQIASFNVLNYFVTIDDSGPICGPTGGMDCRGADTLDEFIRQRTKIINAIVTLDADVIGLMELENHPTDEALKDLVAGLNELAGPNSYAYIDTGVVGSDAIKVALIYKPGVVTPVGAHAVLDSSVDPSFLDTKNRPSIAQTFELISGGGRFTALVNHLKSKGSSCDDVGDPDIGDGQGNCNLTRTAAAIALANWLATDPTGSGDPDFILIGDLNSYAMEDPITALKNAGYTNLVESWLGAQAYSYVFGGQKGYLDHALATPAMANLVTGVVEWHINADEPVALDYNDYNQPELYTPAPFRSSDHDPVLVGFCDAVAPEATVSVTPEVLWPVNRKLVTVTATVAVSDNLDPAPTIELVSVISNEPDPHAEDIVILDDFTFQLRAERLGNREGRTYTITYRVTDACGNSTLARATVTVPHNR